MARRVRDTNLESRTAREKLTARKKPYYRSIGRGVHVGYRKGQTVGRWVARVYLGNGSYSVETLGTADDIHDADGVEILDFWQAQEKARARQVELEGREALRGPYKVKDAISDYLDHLEGRPSHYDVEKRLAAYALPVLGDKELSKLTTADITRWHRDMAKAAPRLRTKAGDKQRLRALDPADPEAVRRRRVSANRVLASLKAAFNFAWREGKVATDGAWRRVKPFRSAESARVRYLAVAEARRLVNAAEGDFRQLVQAALQTGARYGELIALKVEDFNPDAGTVAIRQSKSGRSRHIVLTDEGVELFGQITAGRPGSDVMLRHGERAWHKSEQIARMAAACDAAQIDPPIGFHGLRHTWASLAVMAGVPLMVVAKNLGHADTRMAEKHYAHLAPSYEADAIRAGAPRFGTVPASNVERIEGAAR